MKTIRHFFLLILFSALLFSCGGTDISEKEGASHSDITAIVNDSLPEELPIDNYVLGDSLVLFPERDYHGDEIPDKVEELSWFGLYKTSEHTFRYMKVSVTEKECYDPIMDENENGPFSGRKIATDTSVQPLLLISSVQLTADKEIKGQSFIGKILEPGNEYSLNQFQISGSIHVTGKSGNENPGDFLQWTVEYVTSASKQKLIYLEEASEVSAELFFIGDLNSDGFLDVIYDADPHYNSVRTTLLLSAPGMKNDWVIKKAAEHLSVGC